MQINIQIRCGIGDLFSYLARFPNLKKKYPDSEINLYAGGFGKVPSFMKEIAEFDPNVNRIRTIGNYQFPNQDGAITRYLKNITKENDIFLNWVPDEIPLQHSMQFPFEIKTSVESDEIADNVLKNLGLEKFVCVHPVTRAGNTEGFDTDLRRGRFLGKDQWKKIVEIFLENGYNLVLIGLETETYGLEEIKGVYHAHLKILPTISLIKRSAGVLDCNSWNWEISSLLKIPTICFYLTNRFFIKCHIPLRNQDFWKTCEIITDREVTPKEVFDNFRKLELKCE